MSYLVLARKWRPKNFAEMVGQEHVLRALMRQAPRLLEEVIVVQAHPEVVDLMLGEEKETLDAVEALCQRKLVIRPRGSFHQEQFDIFGASTEALAKKKVDKSEKAERG